MSLSPCPFCGEMPKVNRVAGSVGTIECDNVHCPVIVQTTKGTDLRVEEMWNRRSPQTANLSQVSREAYFKTEALYVREQARAEELEAKLAEWIKPCFCGEKGTCLMCETRQLLDKQASHKEGNRRIIDHPLKHPSECVPETDFGKSECGESRESDSELFARGWFAEVILVDGVGEIGLRWPKKGQRQLWPFTIQDGAPVFEEGFREQVRAALAEAKEKPSYWERRTRAERSAR